MFYKVCSECRSCQFGIVRCHDRCVAYPKSGTQGYIRVFLADLRCRTASSVQVTANMKFISENKHRDFASCHGCGAKTWKQHKLSCPRAAISPNPRKVNFRRREFA